MTTLVLQEIYFPAALIRKKKFGFDLKNETAIRPMHANTPHHLHSLIAAIIILMHIKIIIAWKMKSETFRIAEY